MEQPIDIQGNACAVEAIPLPDVMAKGPGIGKAAMEGIDWLINDVIIGGVGEMVSFAGGAIFGSVGFKRQAGDTGRYEDPGVEPQMAAATPITPMRAQAIEAPSRGQAIERSVSPHEAHEVELGTLIAQASLPMRQQSRGESLSVAYG